MNSNRDTVAIHPAQRDEIAEPLLAYLRSIVSGGGSLPLKFINFHGFQTSRLPDSLLDGVLKPVGLTAAMVQIEIAGVHSDLTHEVHIHERTEAHVTCVGEDFGLPNPQLGFAFMKDRWFPVKLGDSFQIPANVAHGFTVDPGGVMYFLSVQSPPLVSQDGHEDYVIHPFTRWPKGSVSYEP